jgi:nucleotide-binding universal stress UspA family protein
MSIGATRTGLVRLAYDGSENAKAAIRHAGRQLCDGRRAIVLTVGDQEGDADIVVVGSHGRAGIIRLLLGSIAAAVPSHTERPILIVHGG